MGQFATGQLWAVGGGGWGPRWFEGRVQQFMWCMFCFLCALARCVVRYRLQDRGQPARGISSLVLKSGGAALLLL